MYKVLALLAVFCVSANAFVTVTPEEEKNIRTYLGQWNNTLRAEYQIVMYGVKYYFELEHLPKNDCVDQLEKKFISDVDMVATQNYIAFAKICEAQMAEIDDGSITQEELSRLQKLYLANDGCAPGMNAATGIVAEKIFTEMVNKFSEDVKNC